MTCGARKNVRMGYEMLNFECLRPVDVIISIQGLPVIAVSNLELVHFHSNRACLDP